MKSPTNLKELQLMANIIRQDIIRMVSEAGSGHPGGALGLADILAALYFNILAHDPKRPTWDKRDRLILSPGHTCPVRYAAMANAGYFPKKELLSLRKLDSKLQGHPSRVDFPALELSTASLGQGLGVAVGMAVAAKLKKYTKQEHTKQNQIKQNHTIYCITSDGEHDEGSTWEAVSAAQKYKLGNLINIIDRNGIQLSGFTKDIWPLEPLRKKYEAYRWKVFEIDGHNMEEIISVINKAKKVNKPTCIIANTILGKGISFMENKHEWHGRAPKGEEVERALGELRKEKK